MWPGRLEADGSVDLSDDTRSVAQNREAHIFPTIRMNKHIIAETILATRHQNR
jgi:hypothetical protein